MKLHHLYLLLPLSVAIAGCGSSGNTSMTGTGSGPGTQSAAIAGNVHGGEQPVSGAKVYLYAAGTSGYASPPTSLLSGAGYVTTDINGEFAITGDYTCPAAPGDQVYLFAVGGNPGNVGGQVNPNLAMIAALGPCGKLTNSTFIVVNEVSTAAAAYALGPFMGYSVSNPTAGTAINVGIPTGGASCNSAGNWTSTGANTCDYIGLKNAFGMVNELVILGTGHAISGTATMVMPQSRLNTLSNILAACVNSTGGSAHDGQGGHGADSNCGTLFDDTTPSSTGVAPTDTLQAIFNLARTPGPSTTISNSLLGLSPLTAPFQPSLSAAPNDWTLPITLSGGGLNGPTALGIDSAGNAWVVSYNSALSAFTPAGVALFPSGITGDGLNESYGLTVDGSNNVWVSNQEVTGYHLGTIAEFNNSGNLLSGSGYTVGGVYYPQALAADTDGSIWVANYGDSSISHLTSGGGAVAGEGSGGYTSASIEYPDAIAVDGSHNVWVASETTSTITKVSASGTQFTPVTCCDEAAGLAIDSRGNVWSANYHNSTVSEVSSSGAVISSGYTGGGLNSPGGIAVDGSGTVWVANYHGNSLTELAGAGSATPGMALSPPAGFGADVNMTEPYAVSIDASGNVWISNFYVGTVTEFVGLATPVKTPAIGPAIIP